VEDNALAIFRFAIHLWLSRRSTLFHVAAVAVGLRHNRHLESAPDRIAFLDFAVTDLVATSTALDLYGFVYRGNQPAMLMFLRPGGEICDELRVPGSKLA